MTLKYVDSKRARNSYQHKSSEIYCKIDKHINKKQENINNLSILIYYCIFLF